MTPASRALRLGAHRKNVAKRVVGRDATEHIRVVDEGAEKIYAVHHGLAGRHAHHGGVVGRVQADQHVSALHRRKRAQRTRCTYRGLLPSRQKFSPMNGIAALLIAT